MKNEQYFNLVDKSVFPLRGEWDSEPDKEQWIDAATGLPCLLVRQPGHGALCGYVGVNSMHHSFEVGYSDVDVDCHWGLTFSGKCMPEEMSEPKVCHKVDAGEDDNIWWLGFDCAHSRDLCPAYQDEKWLSFGAEYRNVEFVKKQCAEIARQLIAPSTT